MSTIVCEFGSKYCYIVNNGIIYFVIFSLSDGSIDTIYTDTNNLPINGQITFISSRADNNHNCYVSDYKDIYSVQAQAKETSGVINGTFVGHLPSGITSLFFDSILSYPNYYYILNSGNQIIHNSQSFKRHQEYKTVSDINGNIQAIGGKYLYMQDGTNYQVNLYGYSLVNNKYQSFLFPDISNNSNNVFQILTYDIEPSITSMTFINNNFIALDPSNNCSIIVCNGAKYDQYSILYTNLYEITHIDCNFYNKNTSTVIMSVVVSFIDILGNIGIIDLNTKTLQRIYNPISSTGFGSGLVTKMHMITHAIIKWPILYGQSGYNMIYTNLDKSDIPSSSNTCIIPLTNPIFSYSCKISPVYDVDTNYSNIFYISLNPDTFNLDLHLLVVDDNGNTIESLDATNSPSTELYSINVNQEPHTCYVSDLENTYRFAYDNQGTGQFDLAYKNFTIPYKCSTWTINNLYWPDYPNNDTLFYLDWNGTIYTMPLINDSPSTCLTDVYVTRLNTLGGRYGVTYGITINNTIQVNYQDYSQAIYSLNTFSLLNQNEFIYTDVNTNALILFNRNFDTKVILYSNELIVLDTTLINGLPIGLYLDSSGLIYEFIANEWFFSLSNPILLDNQNTYSIYGMVKCVPFNLRSIYTEGINNDFQNDSAISFNYFPLFPLTAKAFDIISVFSPNDNTINACIVINGILKIYIFSVSSTIQLINTLQINEEFQSYISSVYMVEPYICHIIAKNILYILEWTKSSTSPLTSSNITSTIVLSFPNNVKNPVLLSSGILQDINNANITYTILNQKSLYDQSGNILTTLDNYPTWINSKNGHIYGYYNDLSGNYNIFVYTTSGKFANKANIVMSFKRMINPYWLTMMNNRLIFVDHEDPSKLWNYNVFNGTLFPWYKHTNDICCIDADSPNGDILAYVIYLDVSGTLEAYTDFNASSFYIADNLSCNYISIIHGYQTLITYDHNKNNTGFINFEINNIISSCQYNPDSKLTSCFTLKNGQLELVIFDNINPHYISVPFENTNLISIYAVNYKECYVCDSTTLYHINWNIVDYSHASIIDSPISTIIIEDTTSKKYMTTAYMTGDSSSAHITYIMADSEHPEMVICYPQNEINSYDNPIIKFISSLKDHSVYTFTDKFNLYYNNVLVDSFANIPLNNSILISKIPKLLLYIDPDYSSQYNPNLMSYNPTLNQTAIYSKNPSITTNSLFLSEIILGISHLLYYADNLKLYLSSDISQSYVQTDVSTSNILIFPIPNIYSYIYFDPVKYTSLKYNIKYSSNGNVKQSSYFDPLTSYISNFQTINNILLLNIYDHLGNLLLNVPLTNSELIVNDICLLSVSSPFNCLISTFDDINKKYTCFNCVWNGKLEQESFTAQQLSQCLDMQTYTMFSKHSYIYGYKKNSDAVYQYGYFNQTTLISIPNLIFDQIPNDYNMTATADGKFILVDPSKPTQLYQINMNTNDISIIDPQMSSEICSIDSTEITISINKKEINCTELLLLDVNGIVYSYKICIDISATQVFVGATNFISIPINLYAFFIYNTIQNSALQYINTSMIISNYPKQIIPFVDKNSIFIILIFNDGSIELTIYDITSDLLSTLDITTQPYYNQYINTGINSTESIYLITDSAIYSTTFSDPTDISWNNIITTNISTIIPTSDCINCTIKYTYYHIISKHLFIVYSEKSDTIYVQSFTSQITSYKLNGIIEYLFGNLDYLFGCYSNDNSYIIFLVDISNDNFVLHDNILKTNKLPLSNSMTIAYQSIPLFLFINPDNNTQIYGYDIEQNKLSQFCDSSSKQTPTISNLSNHSDIGLGNGPFTSICSTDYINNIYLIGLAQMSSSCYFIITDISGSTFSKKVKTSNIPLKDNNAFITAIPGNNNIILTGNTGNNIIDFTKYLTSDEYFIYLDATPKSGNKILLILLIIFILITIIMLFLLFRKK